MVDLLIIGSGGAGLSAALAAKEEGASVLVVGKQYPTNSQTSMAQGGINAVIDNGCEDSVQEHIGDTINSANGLCDEVMVRTMCQEAPKTIKWLEEIGVPFSRSPEAKIAQRQLGGASHKRACYSQDYTGLKILHTLYDSCLKESIEFLNEHYLLNLTTHRHQNGQQVTGATFLDIKTGETKQIDAKALIIATGGYSSIYHNHTTNAFGCSGDGIAAVLRAGGYISDMEFVQFHPTALKGSAILISESARGEGGHLLNSKGERFVDELLPRDIVARAIHDQLKAGEEVFLDIRHLGESKLMELLPQEVRLCRLHEGVDPLEELIPIKPVAHYSMGGIDTNRSLKVRGVEGCFAIGECANAKIHGANRLGGNSLLEIIALGRIAGKNGAKFAKNTKIVPTNNSQLKKDTSNIDEIFDIDSQINFYGLRDEIGKLFYQNVGITRNGAELKSTLSRIREIKKELGSIGVDDKSRGNNTNLIDLIEFRSAVELGEAILIGAIDRKESRGAHHREDFPQQNDDEFAQHTLLYKEDDILFSSYDRGDA